MTARLVICWYVLFKLCMLIKQQNKH
uniref:Uncharacterized protein n=1 Tax=Arundo donax TaxID=35708 RepID=A0A0A9ABZ5_ARUDO